MLFLSLTYERALIPAKTERNPDTKIPEIESPLSVLSIEFLSDPIKFLSERISLFSLIQFIVVPVESIHGIIIDIQMMIINARRMFQFDLNL